MVWRWEKIVLALLATALLLAIGALSERSGANRDIAGRMDPFDHHEEDAKQWHENA